MTHPIRRRLGPLAVALAAALTLTGCSGPDPDVVDPTTTTAGSTTPTEAEFPRVVDVPEGPRTPAASLTVPTEPRRIAALSYETAELVAALGLADRLVVVPEAVRNPVFTNHPQEMAAVPDTVPTESETDPEFILSLDPDLVLLSARHGLEDGAGKTLTAAGVPVLVLPNSWGDVADMTTNIALVGRATGADAAAEELTGTIADALVPVEEEGTAPRVLALSNQAGRPFITTGGAFPMEVLRLAGGTDVGPDLGIEVTGPITTEQIVAADPDAILLIDMNGSGEASFASVLSNPAVAGLDAVAGGHVLLVEGRQVQAAGLDHTADGLDLVREWLAAL